MTEHPQYPGKPWVLGPLRITRTAYEMVQKDAIASYPSECCGFLAGPASDASRCDEALPETNLADELHASSPETHPRTSETYFVIHPKHAMDAMDAGEKSGRPIKVVYHSHCDAGAYFSEEDAETFSFSGLLMWPCAFLVVSVKEGAVADTRLWVHVPRTDRFEQAAYDIVE